MEREEKVKINISVLKETYDKLEKLRKRKGKMSVPELVREIINQYLERVE